MAKHSDDEIEEFEAILAKRLQIFEDYHLGKREPETERARHFVAVVRGEERPQTKNEKAYLYHLRELGQPVVHTGKRLPSRFQSAPHEINKKWDDAAENMSKWKPWHD